jgi:hypothetical protein
MDTSEAKIVKSVHINSILPQAEICTHPSQPHKNKCGKGDERRSSFLCHIRVSKLLTGAVKERGRG